MSGRKAIVWWKFVLTTARQPTGAPILDKCGGKVMEGDGWRSWHGYALHTAPWHKNRYGDRMEGLALCFGILRRGKW